MNPRHTPQPSRTVRPASVSRYDWFVYRFPAVEPLAFLAIILSASALLRAVLRLWAPIE